VQADRERCAGTDRRPRAETVAGSSERRARRSRCCRDRSVSTARPGRGSARTERIALRVDRPSMAPERAEARWTKRAQRETLRLALGRFWHPRVGRGGGSLVTVGPSSRRFYFGAFTIARSGRGCQTLRALLTEPVGLEAQTTCPPRRSFVASDARRRGQVRGRPDRLTRQSRTEDPIPSPPMWPIPSTASARPRSVNFGK
jgi:hypothetical protein